MDLCWTDIYIAAIKRIEHINVTKALGILAVIVGHYWAPKKLGNLIFSFHMPFFVIFSGYFLKGSINGAKLRKMMKAYLVPYTVTWTVNCFLISVRELILGADVIAVGKDVLWYMAFYFYALGSDSARYRPGHITKVGVIWFLMALFWGQFQALCINRLTNRYHRLAVVVLLWGICFVATSYKCVPLGITNGIAFLPYLYVGGALNKSGKGKKWIKCRPLGILCFFVWAGVVAAEIAVEERFSIAEFHMRLYGLEMVGALAGCAVVIYVSKLFCSWKSHYINRVTDALEHIGENTLWILCVHGIGIEVFTGLFSLLDVWIAARTYNTVGYGIVLLIRMYLDVFLGLAAKGAWNRLRLRVLHGGSE